MIHSVAVISWADRELPMLLVITGLNPDLSQRIDDDELLFPSTPLYQTMYLLGSVLLLRTVATYEKVNILPCFLLCSLTILS